MPRSAKNELPLTPLADVFRVGEWVAEPAWNRIRREQQVLRLEPRVMRLLAALASRPGEPVTRAQLFEAVWPDTVVNEEAQSRAISELRRALGDDPKHPRYIETIRKGGYSLVAPVELLNAPVPQSLVLRAPMSKGPAPARLQYALVPLSAALALGLGVALWLLTRSPAADFTASPELRGVLRPVTSDPGREIDPAISRDGERVVYAASVADSSGYDLFVQSIEGGERVRLTDSEAFEGHPVWSADDEQIAFVVPSGDRAAIHVVPASGGAEKVVLELPGWSFGLDWSPDRRTLAYAEGAPGFAPGISLYDIDAGTRRQLTRSDAAGGDVKPAFSPDGTRVAFLRSDALELQRMYLIDVEGDAPARALTATPGSIRGLDWDADGESIVYCVWVDGRYMLWRLRVDGTSDQPVSAPGDDLFNPSISARGRLVAEVVEQDRDIWRSFLDDGESAALLRSTHDDYDAAYSPDGGSVAFVSERSGTPEIWLQSRRSPGNTQRTHLAKAFVGRPVWSSDGTRIAFYAAHEGNAAIYWMQALRGEPRLALAGPGHHVPIGWTGRDDALLIRSSVGTASKVELLNVATGAVREVPSGHASFADVSSDGRFLYVIPPDRRRVLKIATAGGVHALALPESYRVMTAFRVIGEHGYFLVDEADGTRLRDWDFAAGREVNNHLLPRSASGPLSFSADGRQVLYTAGGETGNDIVRLDRGARG